MAVVNIPITSVVKNGELSPGDTLLTYGGYGVKKLEVKASGTITINHIRVASPGAVFEFPAIGASLPSSFLITYIAEGSSFSIRVVEYGNQGDPDYFNITGVDDFGNPVYGKALDDSES